MPGSSQLSLFDPPPTAKVDLTPAGAWELDSTKRALDDLFSLTLQYRTSAAYQDLMHFVARLEALLLDYREVRSKGGKDMSGLPQPVDRQKEVPVLPAEGHHVVFGTAGSGKTTLAIYRAIYLADRNTVHHGQTILLTFNRCLVAFHGKALPGPSRAISMPRITIVCQGRSGFS